MPSRRNVTIGIVLAAAACVYGWSRTGGGSGIAVRGTVTDEGKPLKAGQILFTPAPNTSSPAVSGAIENGTYYLAPADGLLPGTYEVKVLLPPPSKKDVMQKYKSMEKDSSRDKPDTNRQTDLRVESGKFHWPLPLVIPSDRGEVILDFAFPPPTATGH